MSDVVERAKAAIDGVTEGPWEWDDLTADADGFIWPDELHGVLTGRWHNDSTAGIDVLLADARFIAAARTLVPELVAEVERLRPLKVWVVQWQQFKRPEANSDLFDLCEVFTDWGAAVDKYGSLRDEGYRATFNQRQVYQ